MIEEEPLSIRIQGKPYSVVMRTPGDETAHVAEFCLGEEIIDIRLETAQACVDQLSCHQPLRRRTRASHAAAIYDAQASLLAVAEDVGRHNALDKAVGKVLLNGRLHEAAFVVLSSRVSYELVQKAARARIPILLAVSRPTALAVDLAAQLNMAIACFPRESGFHVYCGEGRILTS